MATAVADIVVAVMAVAVFIPQGAIPATWTLPCMELLE